MIAGLYFL